MTGSPLLDLTCPECAHKGAYPDARVATAIPAGERACRTCERLMEGS